ncbi:MAG TPA: ferredoxin [Mycobacterium sp.]|nr:ferredoxin [Mycobacterium sp.]
MRVEWDESRCALSALCTGLAPDVFRVDDDARLAISSDIDDEQRQAVQDAADSCPTQAITVAD